MTKKTIVLDLEADGLIPKKIWVVVTKHLETQEIKEFYNSDALRKYLSDATEIIGHNIIRYDIPNLIRLWGLSFRDIVLIDTLVMSRLYHPNLEGGHSLESWGHRLKFPKGEYNDWSKLTPEMVEYCKQDVEVTHKAYSFLVDKIPAEAFDLESRVQTIIHQQIENGWLLDQEKCYDLLALLKERKNELEEQVHERFKPLPVHIKEIHPKFKKDGSLSVVGLKFLGDDWINVGGVFNRIDYPTFNLGSRQQIGRYLQWFGWKPEKFTETGQPIVDEKVLENVRGIPEATLIGEYLLVTKRMAQVDSWLTALGQDGRVHGQVNPIGAVTFRMTHSNPNVAQVPAGYSPYGKECRSCWVVPKGYKLVGGDAAGLELRMLAHYMNDEEYTNEILNGDIHTANQTAAGLSTRDQAKTFIYAFLYGAGDAKIGSIVGGTARTGARLKEKFLDNTPALRELRERIDKAAKRGYLKGLDGRKLHLRSAHAALNTLLQSAGALIMKRALVILDEYAAIWELDYKFVGNIHDEIQAEVRENQADKFGWLLVESIKAAGLHYKLNCPLDGEYKIGENWSETH